jgi:hypothetical protein
VKAAGLQVVQLPPANWFAPPDGNQSRLLLGKPPLKPVPGAVAELLPHDEYPYIIEFPAQDFVLNGARQKMRPAQVKAGIVRWKIDGHIIAYSYGLIPVTARRVNGKWEVQSELGCIFAATFIDDKGDGVFRVLVPGALTADLIPRWAQPKEN